MKVARNIGGWVLLLVLLTTSSGNSEILGTTTFTNGATLVGPEHRIRPKFSYIDSHRGLFDETWIDSTNVGAILEASVVSDTDFVFIASRLTNAASDHVCVGFCEEITCDAWCAAESLYFAIGSTDFSPAVVKKVSLRIDALSFGLDSRGGQVVLFTFTVTIDGDRGIVPARSTSWGSLKSRYR